MSTTEDLLGRAHANDLDAILAVENPHIHETIHAVKDNADAIFTWDYEKGARPALNKLYEKAKGAQWNAETDLDWSIDVDQEKVAAMGRAGRQPVMDLTHTPFANWDDQNWIDLDVQMQNWSLSQFLHGEQGALICTAKIVETVPWIDAKYYASTQVMDEARHVEVFAKYLDDKLSGHYPMNVHLGLLLDDIIVDSRWDMTYLGMQIMVEGLALAAFGFMHMMTTEPLLKQLLRYVMADEARHVAFGVLSLKEYYSQLTDREMKERQEFAFEAAVRMRDRLLFHKEVWEHFGIEPKTAIELLRLTPEAQTFTQVLFSKIVPNCKKLGLLEPNDQWLRRRFEEIGVIQFEDWVDTGVEVDQFALGREVGAPTAQGIATS
jgi:hypothetical protein